MKALHMMNYHVPSSDPPPVRVEIRFDPDRVDRSGPIPLWPFAVEVVLSDFRGLARASTGCVEAANEDHAIRRIYIEAIGVLSELLAERVSKGSRS